MLQKMGEQIMNYKTLILIMAILIGMGAHISQSEAAELNFSVQAIIPENQIDKKQSYFDLKMEPGQSQNLAVLITNNSAKDIVVNASANTATTNDNGIAAYDKTTKKPDDSLRVNFSEIAKVEPEISIPANSSVQEIVHISLPKESFKGVVLGGLVFSEKVMEDKKNQKTDNQITNRYAYTIAVQLTETNKEVTPNLKLKGVTAGQVNFRNVILAAIQNDQPTIIKNLKLKGAIYKKNSKKVLYQTEATDRRMAPNSTFNFAIDLDNQEMKPGDYIFKGKASTGGRSWTFSKEFKIKSSEAKTYNKKAVELKANYDWLYAVIPGVILLLIGIIFWLSLKLKRLGGKK